MGWHRRDGTGTRGRNTSKAKYKGQLISRLPDVGDGRQRVTQSAYYRNGQVKTVTDAKGQIVESSYDRANRVVQTRHQHADGSLEEIRTFAYNKVGKPTRVTDLNGATEYVYDELYRVVEERRQPGTADVPPAPSPYSVQSRYDANGNRTKCIYPDTAGIAGTGRVLVSFYDRLNRLTRMEDHGPQASLPAPAVTQYSYDANGNRLSLSLPNGVVDRYEYDSLNRVTAHSSRKGEALIYDCEYRYDLVGNRLRIDETLADADLPGNPKVRHLRYAYDQQYRLVLETWAAGNIRPPRPRPDGADGRGPDAPSGVDAETRSYTFDRAGNRLTMVVERPGATETTRYRYDDLNRLLASRRVSTDSAAPPEETGYSHDINGNRQTKTVGGVTAHYTWDVNDRLVAVDRNGRQVFAASYDYRTRRLSKSERQEDGSLKTTVFRYDQGDSFQEFEGEAKKVEFVRGSGMGGGIGSILYSERAQIDGGVEYFHFNAVGHTVATSNVDGTVKSSNLYEAYGNIVLSTGASQNNRLANTKERDFSIGLDNHGFRYYDPEVGCYISPDLMKHAESANWYTYVNNNPVNHIDPLGLWSLGGLVSWVTTGEYREDANAKELLKASWRGAKEGAKTGGKAFVNATASTVVSTVTLGVKDRVELISVSNEERALYEKSYALQKGGMDVLSGAATGGFGNAGKLGKVVNAFDKANALADKARTGVEVVEAAAQGDLTKVAQTLGTNLAQQQLAKKLNSADASTAKPPEGQKVYRGLAEGEDVSRGLTARKPGAGNSPASHVAGKEDTPLVSKTGNWNGAVDGVI